MTDKEKYDHLNHIFSLIDGKILKCPQCGYPYIEGYICANCRADNSENEEEYPLDELLDSLSEEPVSEDLEKAAKEWEEKTWFTPFYMTLDDKGNPNGVKQDYTTHAESFKAGAKWQKEKDDEEKVLTYKHGFEDCKEQMMTKVIDARCFGFQGAALFSFRLPADNYLVGSKVKVIVIKED